MRRLVISMAMVILFTGTILIFLAFDRTSHSASDTLRPFLLTMVPIWIVAVAVSRRLIRHDRPRR